MVEALSIATSLVGVELHRADAGAHLAFLGAIITDLNATVTIRKVSALRSNPGRKRTHRTERAPSARSIDESQHHCYSSTLFVIRWYMRESK